MSNYSVLAKYEYRRRLPHLQKADAALFVTFCTNSRVLLDLARDIVLAHWLREGGIQDFCGAGTPARGKPRNFTPRIHLHAVVVMPDHVHVLLTPLRDQNGWPFPLVDILQCCKSTTAHRINRLLHLAGPVWEEESFDHVLRSEESFEEKCEYIRQNAVKAELVGRPEDYRWLWVESRPGKSKSRAAGGGARATQAEKERARLISQPGSYFMPAITYSPTHFRVQYHRPSGA